VRAGQRLGSHGIMKALISAISPIMAKTSGTVSFVFLQ